MKHQILKRLSLSSTPTNNYGLFCLIKKIASCNCLGNCARVSDRQSQNAGQKTLSITARWNKAAKRQAHTVSKLNNYQKQDCHNLCFTYLRKRAPFYSEQLKENFSLFCILQAAFGGFFRTCDS